MIQNYRSALVCATIIYMQLLGSYEVVQVLGQGGMGIVYKAFDPAVGRFVAIKAIKLDESIEFRQRFTEQLRKEARAAGRLSHPNIVTIYQVLDPGDTCYLVMEFLEGKTLEQILKSGTPTAEQTALRYLSQAAEALDYAHAQGVIHRDIKPANFLILDNGLLKLLDFGIAKRTDGLSLTAPEQFLGTPSYTAPERLRCEAIDGRADQFSLAVVAFELLAGKRPFPGEALGEIVAGILFAPPTPIYELNPRVGKAASVVLERALSKTPGDRFESCSAFIQALSRSLNLEVLTADLSDPSCGGPQTSLTSKLESSSRNGTIPLAHTLSNGLGRRIVLWGSVFATVLILLLLGISREWARRVSSQQSSQAVLPPDQVPSQAAPDLQQVSVVGDPVPPKQPNTSVRKPQSAPLPPEANLAVAPDSVKPDEPTVRVAAPSPVPAGGLIDSPPMASTLFDEGKNLYDKGQCKEALSKLDHVARTDPANADVQNALGLTYVCLNMPARAQQHFSRAIDIQPGYAAAYRNRGQVFIDLNQFQLAIDDFDWALEKEPENGSLYWRRGEARFGLRHYQDAQKDFTASIACDPNSPHGYYWRGRVFYELGKDREALADFEKAIARNPDLADAIEYRKRTLKRLGQAM